DGAAQRTGDLHAPATAQRLDRALPAQRRGAALPGDDRRPGPPSRPRAGRSSVALAGWAAAGALGTGAENPAVEPGARAGWGGGVLGRLVQGPLRRSRAPHAGGLRRAAARARPAGCRRGVGNVSEVLLGQSYY